MIVGMTRAEQAARTRQTILDTARSLFADRGFSETSLQDIADAMGVGKANVYYYFKTKAAILDVLLDDRIAGLEVMLSPRRPEPAVEVRRAAIIAGYTEEAVRAYRSNAPVDFADPAVRAVPGVEERLNALSARAADALFGGRPTVDQRAGLAVLLDLKPVLRALDGLPDDELRDAVRRLCERLLA